MISTGDLEQREFGPVFEPRIPTVKWAKRANDIGTVKQLMRKALEESKDIHLALLEYHNTPVAGLKYSPAQLLMCRMPKDKVPVTSELLAPKVAKDAYPALKARQQKQKAYYDR